MKQYFLLTVLGIVAISSALFSSVAVAQTPTPKNPPQQGVLVADVSLKDAKIDSQEGASMQLSFTLTNGVMQQTGVRYGVTLIAQKDDTQTVVDEKVYDEVLTLAENSTTPVTFSYTAPTQLTGIYGVYITSKNNNGFPFGIAKAGDVTLSATTKGITIATDTCYTHVSTNPKGINSRLLASPTLDGDKVLELVCSVTNASDEGVTVIPTFETQHVGAYGSLAGTQGGDLTPLLFGAKETKVVTIALPKASKPQMYVVNVSLEGLGVASNTVSAHYNIPGATALIANANLDKDYYVKGEAAKVSILWGGNQKEVQGTISIKNAAGRDCVEKTTQTLSIDQAKLMTIVELPITRDCYGPQLAVTFKDSEGNVLDAQEYDFDTTSVPKPVMPWQTAALIIGGIVVLGVVALYVRNRLNTQHHENIV